MGFKVLPFWLLCWHVLVLCGNCSIQYRSKKFDQTYIKDNCWRKQTSIFVKIDFNHWCTLYTIYFASYFNMFQHVIPNHNFFFHVSNAWNTFITLESLSLITILFDQHLTSIWKAFQACKLGYTNDAPIHLSKWDAILKTLTK